MIDYSGEVHCSACHRTPHGTEVRKAIDDAPKPRHHYPTGWVWVELSAEDTDVAVIDLCPECLKKRMGHSPIPRIPKNEEQWCMWDAPGESHALRIVAVRQEHVVYYTEHDDQLPEYLSLDEWNDLVRTGDLFKKGGDA